MDVDEYRVIYNIKNSMDSKRSINYRVIDWFTIFLVQLDMMEPRLANKIDSMLVEFYDNI